MRCNAGKVAAVRGFRRVALHVKPWGKGKNPPQAGDYFTVSNNRARNKVRKGNGEPVGQPTGVTWGRNLIARVEGRNLIARVEGSQPNSASRGVAT